MYAQGGETLRKETGYYIKTINGIMEKQFNRKLKEYDLTKSQFDILLYLWKHPNEDVKQRDLENFFKVSNPTITGILDRLQDKGLIARVHCPSDKRIHHIVLTEKCGEFMQNLAMQKPYLEKNVETILGKEETDLLKALLDKVLNGLLEKEEFDA